MANLLELVDIFIGNVLKGNVYTDTQPFRSFVLKQPSNIESGIPKIDNSSKPLGFDKGPAHPHDNFLDARSGKDIIPPPTHGSRSDSSYKPLAFTKGPEHPHDNFIDTVSGKPIIPPPTHGSRNDNSYKPLGFDKGPEHPHDNFKDPVSGKYIIPPPIHGPPALARDEIYLKSKSFNRTSDASDLINFHKSIEQQINDRPNVGRLRNGTEGHRFGNQYDDRSAETFLFDSQGGKFASEVFVGPLKYFDVFAIANWFKNISREFGVLPRANNNIANPAVERSGESIVKGITWAASQLLLTALNPGDIENGGPLNKIWNPLSLPLSLIPGTRVSTPISNITLGSVIGDYKTNSAASVAAGTERLLLMRKGVYAGFNGIGFLGDVAKVGDMDTLERPAALPVSIEAQVDQDPFNPLFYVAKAAGVQANVYSPDNNYLTSIPEGTSLTDIENKIDENSQRRLPLVGNARPRNVEELDKQAGSYKLSKLFTPQKYPGSTRTSEKSAYAWTADVRVPDPFGGLFQAALPGPDELSTRLLEGDDTEDGVVADPIDDSKLYFPFMFQDLRQNFNQFLYFRAFLKPESLAESFTPEWNSERYYGRVDQIPVYQGTIRTINVAFDVVAWGPSDLPVMWRKLSKLQSMVYPAYDTRGFLQSGPIIRMRIGDLFASTADGTTKGLPGYISSMDWSYDDGIWNLKEDFKVPRKVTVSLSFIVIHNGNPGLYPYSDLSDIPLGATEETLAGRAQGGPTFGAGTFTRTVRSGGETTNGNIDAKVSRSEIRKIFDTVRNTSRLP